MSPLQLRSWLNPLRTRRRSPIRRRPTVRLGLETFEARDLPSSSIPLSGDIWTSIGPSPISNGQGVGGLTATGRVTNVAVVPSTGALFAATASSGLWVSNDGGNTWNPKTDQLGLTIG